jgi:hypothetical protein
LISLLDALENSTKNIFDCMTKYIKNNISIRNFFFCLSDILVIIDNSQRYYCNTLINLSVLKNRFIVAQKLKMDPKQIECIINLAFKKKSSLSINQLIDYFPYFDEIKITHGTDVYLEMSQKYNYNAFMTKSSCWQYCSNIIFTVIKRFPVNITVYFLSDLIGYLIFSRIIFESIEQIKENKLCSINSHELCEKILIHDPEPDVTIVNLLDSNKFLFKHLLYNVYSNLQIVKKINALNLIK